MTNYIEPEALAEMLQDPSKKMGEDYVIVDVRDVDYVGGNIPGAVNVPTHELFRQLPELLVAYEKVPLVVFHCVLSQVRGPKSARIYTESRAHMKDQPPQDIRVLREGFVGWQARFHDVPGLVENYNPKMWEDGAY